MVLPDDGIYILLKEVLITVSMNLLWALVTIEVSIIRPAVRDYGRGIPLEKWLMLFQDEYGGKYDSLALKKSVGLNGVGTKAVNALSNYFRVESVRDDKQKLPNSQREFGFRRRLLIQKRKGTKVTFYSRRSYFKKLQIQK
jgi:topoisomerase-4 subunit B